MSGFLRSTSTANPALERTVRSRALCLSMEQSLYGSEQPLSFDVFGHVPLTP